MSEQLVKDKQLFADYLREDCHELTEDNIEEIVSTILFSAALKINQKFHSLRKKSKLEAGMIVTVKDKKVPLMYAGKVRMSAYTVGIGDFEVYYAPK